MPWLMKAEPDSRVVKGKDVKFSVDDFEAMGTSPWDGVRNHEAKNIMKSKMKVGDKVLFYHSNTKVPGIFALAEVAREGYPDRTSHPYYDPKTSQSSPTWYMIDVRFLSRLQYPPTLALIRYLASSTSLPDEVQYIGQKGFQALKGMALVNRGRLSVQPVEQVAYDAIEMLGTKGGWDTLVSKGKGNGKRKSEAVEDGQDDEELVQSKKQKPATQPKKATERKNIKKEDSEKPPVKDLAHTDTAKRRSKRLK
ncbi:EVE domain-domain-containing protein [Naematelia encephala]|uniref:EVE domain-domain-containing protein n=1 Tax=Naematelia encephala TaxID=71784 RepID=A0A1Y2AZN5_9TREE|nr:EVE domain-domain-containing protein [Naematelia encephala]